MFVYSQERSITLIVIDLNIDRHLSFYVNLSAIRLVSKLYNTTIYIISIHNPLKHFCTKACYSKVPLSNLWGFANTFFYINTN